MHECIWRFFSYQVTVSISHFSSVSFSFIYVSNQNNSVMRLLFILTIQLGSTLAKGAQKGHSCVKAHALQLVGFRFPVAQSVFLHLSVTTIYFRSVCGSSTVLMKAKQGMHEWAQIAHHARIDSSLTGTEMALI